MDVLLDKNYEEITKVITELGYPKFRAQQVYEYMLNNGNSGSLPKDIIAKLSQNYVLQPVKIYKSFEGKGAIKYLYQLYDDNLIEGILMFNNYGNTLCISTQVGCRMGCKFCASTLNGLVRNLSDGEILGQYIAVNRSLGGSVKDRKIANIVLMGSGEPLDNYDNVLKFLHNVCDESFCVSRRNISLSTCGLCDKIKQLADDFPNLTLTISLHSTTDEKRRELMPIANKYNLKDLMDSARYYFDKTKRRVIFEYALIDGKTDTLECAKQLKSLMHGLSYHINLIPLNTVKERQLERSKNENQFLNYLLDMNMSATIRHSAGNDIEGACGQLRQKHLSDIIDN